MESVWEMDKLQYFLYHISFYDILEILPYIGLAYFIIRRFILHKSPVPSSAFGKVSKELLQKCVAFLKKREKREYGQYTVPEDILDALKENIRDEETLKALLCSICAHLGINGDFIKLVVIDDRTTDWAGQISTDLAFTTIRLDLRTRYTLDTVIAVLAHEATHLHLYYEGIHFKDTWENEVLTDTAAVYCGFGEYIYKGYAVTQGEFALSYNKVGYIRQEDVRYIQELMESNREKGSQ